MAKSIKGYRTLSAVEIMLVNEGKELAEQVEHFLAKVSAMQLAECQPDKRWLAIGTTQLQQGFMAVTRAITKPTTF